MLPTNHGFDEFFGNLYHLNAEEEPENEDYPKDPEFRKSFGPRGVIHSWANPDGTQRIEDTGPLTRKRMETVDDETSDRAHRLHRGGRPRPASPSSSGGAARACTSAPTSSRELRGISGQDEYADGMVEHDMHIGKFLKTLDELGIADNTIVFYSTDNGPHTNTWPDAAMTPFRGEKNTNWEGGWRVPAMVRWPGQHRGRLGLEPDHAPHGLAADLPGRRRRPEHQGEAAQGRSRPTGATTRSTSTATTSCRS